jgi:hypothetical protein
MQRRLLLFLLLSLSLSLSLALSLSLSLSLSLALALARRRAQAMALKLVEDGTPHHGLCNRHGGARDEGRVGTESDDLIENLEQVVISLLNPCPAPC